MLALSTAQWTFLALAVFGAAVVRGISGFGFSLTMIVLLTLLLPPTQATPVILLWEILASVMHLPFVWRQVDWKVLRWLSAGVVLGTPLGVQLLICIPPTAMILAINVTVMVLTIFMLMGHAPKRALTTMETVGTGMLSGIINGASANGGPPVILMFLSGPAGAAVGRASLIAFFLFTDVWASAICIQQGLMHTGTCSMALLLAPALALGLWVGSKLFVRIDEVRFKRLMMFLLLLISAVGAVRAFVSAFSA